MFVAEKVLLLLVISLTDYSPRAGSPQSSSGQRGLPGETSRVVEYLPKSLIGLACKITSRSDKKCKIVPFVPFDNNSALVRTMLWRLNGYQTIIWTDIDQMMFVTVGILGPNCITFYPLFWYPGRLLVSATHLEMQRPQPGPQTVNCMVT